MATLTTASRLGYAHGDEIGQVEDDRREVDVRLHVFAIPRSIAMPHRKTLQLTHAYLSTFSVQLFSCQRREEIQSTPTVGNWLNWLIPSAYANHGVRFTKSTQIPIRTQLDLR